MNKYVVAILCVMAIACSSQATIARPLSTPQPVTALPTVTVCQITTGIIGGTVNLRACAGTSCAVMDVLAEGETLTVISSGAWMKVNSAGMTGFVNSRYCK